MDIALEVAFEIIKYLLITISLLIGFLFPFVLYFFIDEDSIEKREALIVGLGFSILGILVSLFIPSYLSVSSSWVQTFFYFGSSIFCVGAGLLCVHLLNMFSTVITCFIFVSLNHWFCVVGTFGVNKKFWKWVVILALVECLWLSCLSFYHIDKNNNRIEASDVPLEVGRSYSERIRLLLGWFITAMVFVEFIINLYRFID